MKTNRMRTMIYCETCPAYQNPKQVLGSSTHDWVHCASGCTVKHNTRGCHLHPENNGIPKSELIEPKHIPSEEDDSLLGGIDFHERLIRDIEALAQ